MLGQAAVAMWWDLEPGLRTEFEQWHTYEHMPERLRIPGFLRGSRWVAPSGPLSYFVLYEVADFSVLTGPAYLERLDAPTPWSRKMMPHHRNMTRSLCRVRASAGGGMAHALATIRFTAADALPELPQREGITSAHLLQSELPRGLPQTAEQKIRGKDVAADWAMLVGGYDFDLLGKHGAVHRLDYILLPGEVP